jgi:hypothetical protein
MDPPCDIVGSAEKRQRWEKEHRQWAENYADAQALREAEERRRTIEEDAYGPALSDDDFLARLLSL